VTVAAFLWFCYGITGDRNSGVMIVTGVIVLLLLVPIVRRHKPRK